MSDEEAEHQQQRATRPRIGAVEDDLHSFASVDVVEPDEGEPGIVDEDIEGRERTAGVLLQPDKLVGGYAVAGRCRDLRDAAQVDVVGFQDIVRARVAAIEIGDAVDLTGTRARQIKSRHHIELGACAACHGVKPDTGIEGIVAAQPEERVVAAAVAGTADEVVVVVVSGERIAEKAAAEIEQFW